MSRRRFAKTGTSECPVCGAEDDHYPDCTYGRPPMPDLTPLSAEELARMKRLCENAEDGWDVLELGIQPEHVLRLLARVATAEQEVALRDAVRNALARLDGHTCHAGHTDADHLRLYRQVVAEIEEVLRDA